MTIYAPIQKYQGAELDIASNYAQGALTKEKLAASKQQRQEKEMQLEGKEALRGVLADLAQGGGSKEDYEQAVLQAMSLGQTGQAGVLMDMRNMDTQDAINAMKLLAAETQAQAEALQLAQNREKFETDLTVKVLDDLRQNIDGMPNDQIDEMWPQLVENIENTYRQEALGAGFDPDEVEQTLKQVRPALLQGDVETRKESLDNFYKITRLRQIPSDLKKMSMSDRQFLAEVMPDEYASMLTGDSSATAAQKVQRDLTTFRTNAQKFEAEGDMDKAEEMWKQYNELYGAAKIGEKGAMVTDEGITDAPGYLAFKERKSASEERGKQEEKLSFAAAIEEAKMQGKGAVSEREKMEKAEQMRKERKTRAGRTVIQDINRGIEVLQQNMDRKYIPTTAAGSLATIARFIPTTDADTLEKFADSVKSNISIDELQAMRESSPTGGALGQVPVQQQEYLMQLLGSLDVTQKPEVLMDNMKRISNIYMDIVHGEGNGGKRFALSFDENGKKLENKDWQGISAEMADTVSYTKDSPARPTTQQEYDALPKGAYFVDDEGLKQK